MNRVPILSAAAGFAVGVGVAVAWQPVFQATVANAASGPVAPEHADDAAAARAAGTQQQGETGAKAIERGSTGRERQVQFTPELTERILEVAREVDSDLADELRSVCDHDPHEFERVIRRTQPRLLALTQLKDRDPKLYETKLLELTSEAEVARVAKQIAEARLTGAGSEQEVLMEQLRMVVRMEIGFSLKARGDYLLRLHEHLEAQREKLDQDAANFDLTVEKRMEEAIQQAMRAVESTARRTR